MGTGQSCLRGSTILDDGRLGRDRSVQQQAVHSALLNQKKVNTDDAQPRASGIQHCPGQFVSSQGAIPRWLQPHIECTQHLQEQQQLQPAHPAPAPQPTVSSLQCQKERQQDCPSQQLQQQQVPHLAALEPAAVAQWVRPSAHHKHGKHEQHAEQQQQQQQGHSAALHLEKASWVESEKAPWMESEKAPWVQSKPEHEQSEQQAAEMVQQQQQLQWSDDEDVWWSGKFMEQQQQQEPLSQPVVATPQQQQQQQQQRSSQDHLQSCVLPHGSIRGDKGSDSITALKDMQHAFERFNPNSPQPGWLGFPEQPWLPLNHLASGPPRPHCEDERLQVAWQVGHLLQQVPKEPLQSILRAVCCVFRVKMAMVVLCGDRCIHIPVAWSSEGEFVGDPSWRNSFCGWMLSSEQPSVLVVSDAQQDARFRNNKHVQAGTIRSYCGAPLVSSTGHRLGTLALIDSMPRVYDTSSLQLLINLAELTMREMEVPVTKQQQQQQQQQQQHACRQQQQQQQQQPQHTWFSDPGPAAMAVTATAADVCIGTTSSFTAEQQLVTSHVGRLCPQQYQMLLRTAECVTSAVALVDPSRPGWPILHGNSCWQHFIGKHKQCVKQDKPQSLATFPKQQHTSSSSACSPRGSSSSSRPPWQQQQQWQCSSSSSWWDVYDVASCELLWELLDPTHLNQMQHSSSSSSSSSSTHCPMVRSLQCLTHGFNRDAAGSAGYPGGPVSLKQQVLQQVQGRQSFVLKGMKLSKRLGGLAVDVSFRCAGYSVLEDAAAVCLPPSQPDASELPHALALQSFTGRCSSSSSSSGGGSSPFANAADNPSATTAAISGCLYFVTVRVRDRPAAAAAVTRSNGISTVGCSSQTHVIAHRDGKPVDDSGYLEMSSRGSKHTSSRSSNSSSNMCVQHGTQASGSSSSSSSEVRVAKPASSSEIPGSSSSISAICESNGASISGSSVYCSCSSNSEVKLDSGSGQLYSSGNQALSSSNNCSVCPTLWPCSYPQFADIQAQGFSHLVHSLAGLNQQRQQLQLSSGRESSSFNPGTLMVFTSLDVPAGLTNSKSMFSSSSSSTGANCSLASSSSSSAICSTHTSTAAASHEIHSSSPHTNPSSSRSSNVQGYCMSAIYADLVCSKLPNLVLGGQIIAGSCGRVYRAEYHGEKVAVKVLPGHTVLPMFCAEGLSLTRMLSGQLQHRNIVKTHAWAVVAGPQQQVCCNGVPCAAAAAGRGSAAAAAAAAAEGTGQTWLIQEYCDKGSLQDAIDCGWLRDNPCIVSGAVDACKVMAAAAEIASAMALLHQLDILHGALSATNVLLSSGVAGSQGGWGLVAKLTNIGLEQQHLQSGPKSNPYGSLAHLAPEVHEQGPLSKAADVYSFGVLLWQMLTGSRAWAGLPHTAVVQAVCQYKRQLAFPDDSSPLPLVLLSRACMAFNPAERPSFRDIVEILQPVREARG